MTKSNHSRTLPIVAAITTRRSVVSRGAASPNAVLVAMPVSFFNQLFSTDVPHMTAQPVILQAEHPTSEAFCDRGIARSTLVGTSTEGRSVFKRDFGPGSPRQNASPRLALGLIRQGGQATAAWGGALPFVPADVIVRSGVQFPQKPSVRPTSAILDCAHSCRSRPPYRRSNADVRPSVAIAAQIGCNPRASPKGVTERSAPRSRASAQAGVLVCGMRPALSGAASSSSAQNATST
jgi:hypothetical protein